MTVELAPAAGEPELTDPQFVGEWADAFAELCEAEAPAPWCVYLARQEGRLVGVGLFKGLPDADNWVELAYLAFVQERGRGIATAIAARLVEIALGEGVAGIRGHTLPEENSSAVVLQRNGFACLGIVVDPDDGEVWRWELRPGALA